MLFLDSNEDMYEVKGFSTICTFEVIEDAVNCFITAFGMVNTNFDSSVLAKDINIYLSDYGIYHTPDERMYIRII